MGGPKSLLSTYAGMVSGQLLVPKHKINLVLKTPIPKKFQLPDLAVIFWQLGSINSEVLIRFRVV